MNNQNLNRKTLTSIQPIFQQYDIKDYQKQQQLNLRTTHAPLSPLLEHDDTSRHSFAEKIATVILILCYNFFQINIFLFRILDCQEVRILKNQMD